MSPLPTFRPVYLLSIVIVATTTGLQAQPTVTTYAQGLTRPMGIEVDGQGRLWVAQQGSGHDDSQIAIVTTDGQVHPFIDGLPSGMNPANDVTGSSQTYFDDAGNLIIVQGQGPRALSASILFVDTAGFSPGNTPLTPAAVHTVYAIGSFMADEGFGAETNPFSVAFGSNGDMFITDAAANALVRREAETGTLSVLTTFAKVRNDTGIGTEVVDAVPTGILLADDHLYVSSFTGFPFGDGAASIYDVDLEGKVSIFKSGLTTLVDIEIDPSDGEMVVLQHAAFKPPPPFAENSGAVLKLRGDGSVEVLVSGLSRPSAMRFSPSGDLFISLLLDGEILKVEGIATASEPEGLPGTSFHVVNYPNPFSSQTTIGYQLAETGRVSITISDALGREARRLTDAVEVAGPHQAIWDGRDNTGKPAASGVYLYRIASEKGVASWIGHLVR